MMSRLVALCLLLTAPAALAQMPAAGGDQEEMMKMMHLAARNQLGVLEYCRAQGSVGADVVDLQKKMMTTLPPMKVDGLEAAEAAGRKGMVQFGGTELVLADAAKAQGTTPDAMCKQMGEMMKAQSASLPK